MWRLVAADLVHERTQAADVLTRFGFAAWLKGL
jgi:hypothetical protein